MTKNYLLDTTLLEIDTPKTFPSFRILNILKQSQNLVIIFDIILFFYCHQICIAPLSTSHLTEYILNEYTCNTLSLFITYRCCVEVVCHNLLPRTFYLATFFLTIVHIFLVDVLSKDI